MFRQTFTDKATELLKGHELYHQGWRIIIDSRPRRRLGICRYNQKIIGITGWYIDLNEEVIVMDTVRHEIAHVLSPGCGHNVTWRRACMRLGARPRAKKDTRIIKMLPKDWAATCPICNNTYQLSRKPAIHRIYFCPCASNRQPLRWEKNQQLKAAANGVVIPYGQDRVNSLLEELGRATSEQSKKIRTQLRKLGHRGGRR